MMESGGGNVNPLVRLLGMLKQHYKEPLLAEACLRALSRCLVTGGTGREVVGPIAEAGGGAVFTSTILHWIGERHRDEERAEQAGSAAVSWRRLVRLCCLCLGDMAYEYLDGSSTVDDNGNVRSEEVEALCKTCAVAVISVLAADADEAEEEQLMVRKQGNSRRGSSAAKLAIAKMRRISKAQDVFGPAVMCIGNISQEIECAPVVLKLGLVKELVRAIRVTSRWNDDSRRGTQQLLGAVHLLGNLTAYDPDELPPRVFDSLVKEGGVTVLVDIATDGSHRTEPALLLGCLDALQNLEDDEPAVRAMVRAAHTLTNAYSLMHSYTHALIHAHALIHSYSSAHDLQQVRAGLPSQLVALLRMYEWDDLVLLHTAKVLQMVTEDQRAVRAISNSEQLSTLFDALQQHGKRIVSSTDSRISNGSNSITSGRSGTGQQHSYTDLGGVDDVGSIDMQPFTSTLVLVLVNLAMERNPVLEEQMGTFNGLEVVERVMEARVARTEAEAEARSKARQREEQRRARQHVGALVGGQEQEVGLAFMLEEARSTTELLENCLQLLMVIGHFEESVAVAVASSSMGVVKRAMEQRMNNQQFVDQVGIVVWVCTHTYTHAHSHTHTLMYTHTLMSCTLTHSCPVH
jgi:hypothetical protein